jgi:hypothetical protein
MQQHEPLDHSKWSALSYVRKAALLHKCFACIQPLIQKQLALIEEVERHNHNLDQKAAYAVRMIKSFYQELDYALALSKTKYRVFIYHPARSCFEKLMHVAFFWQSNQETKDRLVRLELLRSIQDLFIKYSEDGDVGQAEQHKKDYQKNAQNEDPDIEGARIKPLLGKGLEEVCRISGFVDHKGLYRSYRDLCDQVHSGMVATVYIPDREAFLNSVGLTSLFRSALDMLWAADALLFPSKPLKKSIEDAKRVCLDITSKAIA